MAIMMMFEGKGAGEAEYRATNDHLGIAGDDDAPDGLVSHVAGLTDEGLLIVDVWESKEARRVRPRPAARRPRGRGRRGG